jgi:hypothetical protein
MKVTLVLFLFLAILNNTKINASDLEKEYVIHNNNPKVTAKLKYSCSAITNEESNPTQKTLNLEAENISFNFAKMIGTFKDADVEGTISFSFASTGIKIEIIFNSKESTKCDENWEKIQNGISKILSGESLIRFMAIYVSGGKVNKGDERKALLGTYYDEVQSRVDWAYETAQDIWKGMYPNGEAIRKSIFGADYDLIQFWVNQLIPGIYVPTNIQKITDSSGKRYLVKDVPTSRGKITWKGYNQHTQGNNPYKFDESGCSFMAFYGVISTIKGYNYMPIEYADKKLKAVTGGAKCPISVWAGCKLLQSEGIKYKWVKGDLNTNKVYKDIADHLSKGMPVIVSLSKDNRAGKEDQRYTRFAHWTLLIGVTRDRKQGYLLDSGYKYPRFIDLWDLCDHIRAARDNPEYAPMFNGWSNCGGYVKVEM